MCGISGIVSKKRALNPIIRNMVDSMTHRGPDNSSIKIINNIALGHNRLSIIDLSVNANQPMTNAERNFTITFNGEIFNYQELREDLIAKGIIFNTYSDTEVLLNGYIFYGTDFFKKLRGFYSLAILDSNRKKLILTRDYHGKKPLFYSMVDGEFIFASEIKGILSALKLTPDVNYEGLSHFLWKGYYVDKHTAYNDIFSLEPGKLIEISTDDCNYSEKSVLEKVNIHASLKIDGRDTKVIESELLDAIRSRMISDVPISYLLSGGVDSSLICYFAGLESKIDTYFLGYESEEKKFEELSKYVSKKIDSNHTIIHMKRPIFEKALNQMNDIFDEPFGDYSALPSYEIYSHISKKTKVAISGDGADEIFAGYKDSRLFLIRALLNLSNNYGVKNINEGLAKLFNSTSRTNRYFGYLVSLLFLSERALSLSTYRGGWNHSYRKRMMTYDGYELTGGIDTENREAEIFMSSGENALERYLNYDMRRLTYDFLVKVDRTSMANSLEVRSPFLDTTLLKNLNQVNILNMVDQNQTKKELKTILKSHGLEKITKPNKQGFTPPLALWMTSDDGINEVRKLINDDFINKLFKKEALNNLTKSKDSIVRHQSRLWYLMLLRKWHKNNYGTI